MKTLAQITQVFALAMFFFIGLYAVQKGLPKYKDQHIFFVDKVTAVGGGLLCFISILAIIFSISK